MGIDTYPPLDVLAQPLAVTARMRKSGNQAALVATTWAKATWQLTEFDSDNMADLANNRYVIRTPGRYFVRAMVAYLPTATAARRIIAIWKGEPATGAELRRTDRMHVGTTEWDAYEVSGLVDLAAGDLITVGLWSGNATTPASGGTFDSSFDIFLVSGNANGVPSGAKVARNVGANGLFIHATWTTVPWNIAETDTDAIWDGGGRLYARKAGWYAISGVALITAHGTGYHRIGRILKNGTDSVGEGMAPGSAGGWARIHANAVTFLHAGDYVEFQGYQDSGVNLRLEWNGPEAPGEFSMVCLTGTTVSTRQPPQVLLRSTGQADQSMPAGVWTKITSALTTVSDTDGAWSSGTFICKTPGTYVVNAGAEYTIVNTGTARQIGMKVNDAWVAFDQKHYHAAIAHVQITKVVELKVGDIVEFFFWHDGASAIALRSSIPNYVYAELLLQQPMSVAVLNTPEAWREVGAAGQPGFQNAWANYGSGYTTAAFYKDPLGVVHLRGLLRSGSVGVPAFTLPEGYRPAAIELIGTISNGAAGRIDVTATGNVTPTSPSSNVWVTLSGLSFRAA